MVKERTEDLRVKLNPHKRRMFARVVGLVIAAMTCYQVHAAMHLSEDGTGQVLIYPVYTVNGGYDTLLSLTNATSDPKLVAMRFLDSQNSRLVFGLHVYLGAYDVWTAALSKSVSGGVTIKTSDKTCTQPVLPAAGLVFSTSNFTEGFDNSIARTTMGHIEVIEAANIRAGSSTQLNLTHTNGVPKNCSALPGAGASASGETLGSPDFLAPTGGISGNVSLINVAGGVEYSYDAIAIAGAFDSPQLHVPNRSTTTLENANRSITLNANGKTYAAQFADGIDAISALFQRSSLTHDWIVDPELNAGTDIVTTFPTKRFYTTLFSGTVLSREPFTARFGANGAPEPVLSIPVSREASIGFRRTIFFPVEPPYIAPEFRYVTSFATINGSHVLSSPHSTDIRASGLMAGFLINRFVPEPFSNLELSNENAPSNLSDLVFDERRVIRATGTSTVDGVACPRLAFRGLPAIGLTAHRYVNSNVGGVLSNYGAFNVARSERKIECER